jgi:hypothetical protein
MAPIDRVLCEVPGWLSKPEASLLYEFARDWPGTGDVVEIGSYQGRSTICLAFGVAERKSGRVISVDMHTGSREHQPGKRAYHPETFCPETGGIDTLALLRANLSLFEVAEVVQTRVMTSVAAAATFTSPVRLLFIDADHHVQSVLEDLFAWKCHLEKGACVILHDVGGWPGPTAAARRLVATGRFLPVRQADSALALRAE